MEKTKDANYYSAAEMRAIADEMAQERARATKVSVVIDDIAELENRLTVLRAALDAYIWGISKSLPRPDVELIRLAEKMRAELGK